MSNIDIAVERPLLFLILIPALLLGIIPFLRLNKKRRASTKHLIPFIIHLTLIFLLSGLLAGIKVTETTDEKLETKVVFLADVSESNIHMKDEMNKYIKSVVNVSDKEKTKFAVVMFANNVVKVVDDDEFDTNASDFIQFDKSGQKLDQTNIEQAIKVGAELFSELKQNKKMVVLSDGIETLGNGITAANQLKDGIQISGAHLSLVKGENKKNEVQLVSINTNSKVPEGGDVTVELVLRATSFVSNATITLTDGDIKTQMQLDIDPGVKVVKMTYTPEVVGVNTICATVEVDARRDLLNGNNTLYTWYSLDAQKSILIVDGDFNNPEQPGQFEQIKNSSVLTKLKDYAIRGPISPKQFPSTLEGLLEYDQVVMMDVNFADLPENAGENLKRYVDELGRGLFVSFGDNFYDIGADGYEYKKSPIADILPVELTLEGERETVAMVLVVDLSSSMKKLMGSSGRSRFELVVESVKKVLMLGATEEEQATGAGFSDTDYVGIVCFDQDSHVALEMQQLGNAENRAEICELVEYELRHYYYYHYLDKDGNESDIPIGEKDGDKYTSQGYKKPDNFKTDGGVDEQTKQYIKSYGTSYKWAIQSASDMLSKTNNKTLLHIKQVLFMSDGAPNDKGSGYEGIVERMATAGTVTSTISIGADDAGQIEELQKIAEAGKGTTVRVNTPEDLSDSIVEKAEEVTAELVNEREVLPMQKSLNSSVLVGVRGYETIGGYYSSVIKEEAELVVYVDQLKPLYAEWQYGLGKVSVYMSDLGNSDWTGVLFNNNDSNGINLVTNMFNATMNRQVTSTGLDYSVSRDEAITTVVVNTPEEIRKNELLLAKIIDEKGNVVSQTPLTAIAVRKYRAEISTPNLDETYVIQLSLEDQVAKKGKVKDRTTFAVTGYYNTEYDVFNTEGETTIKGMIANGGGIDVSSDKVGTMYDDTEGIIRIFDHDASTPVAIIALILFILDILFRNIVVTKKKEKVQMTDEEQRASMRGR